ncbi:MAG: 7-cyano-7-deazaguanine synthase [Candidatus Bathyarchaeia archaeon]
MGKPKEASVLFSGGSDSTLAAAWCAERFDKVHLLNFHHSGMHGVGKSSINVKRLRKKYGEYKFVFKVLDIEEPFHTLYYKDYSADLRRYGTFLAAATCNICQLAMHVETIIYDVQNGVGFACDGYKKEKQHVYIVMSQKGIDLLKAFYAKYGIKYENPIYDVFRTDWVLYDKGITPKRDVKFPYERLSYEAQHSCFHGILTNAYILGYHYPLHLDRSNRWLEYFKRKLELAEDYIDKRVKGLC